MLQSNVRLVAENHEGTKNIKLSEGGVFSHLDQQHCRRIRWSVSQCSTSKIINFYNFIWQDSNIIHVLVFFVANLEAGANQHYNVTLCTYQTLLVVHTGSEFE